MAALARWSVQLTGDDFDLEELPRMYPEAHLRVSSTPQGFTLEAAEFDACEAAECVRRRAEGLIVMINGAVRLILGGFKPVSIGSVLESREGVAGVHHFMIAESGEYRAKLKDVVLRRGEVVVPSPLGPASAWVQRASKDRDVEKVLRLSQSTRPSWADLYRIFEVVQSRVGGEMHTKGWVSKKKVELFSRTANSVDAIGDEARHGDRRVPGPLVPMGYDEARKLVDNLLREWLKSLDKED